MVWKHLQVEFAGIVLNKAGAPVHQVMDHVDDIMDPNATEFRIDQLATITLNDVLKVHFGTVIFSHGSSKPTTRHCCRAAGRFPFGHLNNIDTSVSAFEGCHGRRSATANDKNICFKLLFGNFFRHRMSFSCLSFLETFRHKHRQKQSR